MGSYQRQQLTQYAIEVDKEAIHTKDQLKKSQRGSKLKALFDPKIFVKEQEQLEIVKY